MMLPFRAMMLCLTAKLRSAFGTNYINASQTPKFVQSTYIIRRSRTSFAKHTSFGEAVHHSKTNKAFALFVFVNVGEVGVVYVGAGVCVIFGVCSALSLLCFGSGLIKLFGNSVDLLLKLLLLSLNSLEILTL